jgi:hypothetical protein
MALKAKRPTAAITPTRRTVCPVNVADATTITIGISIRTATPNNAAGASAGTTRRTRPG